MGTFEEKIKQCITRTRAMVSRTAHTFVLYHKVDNDGTLGENRLQEFEVTEPNLIQSVIDYAKDHADEHHIQQHYVLRAFEKDAPENNSFTSIDFRVRGGLSAPGESMPANAHGMIRQNMTHTEFFAKWGAERVERSAQVVESVMTKAVERAERETRRWRRRAIAAEKALREWLKVEGDQIAARAKAELEMMNTKHKVATRQRFADEAIKLFPVVATSITGYVAKKLKGRDKPLALPQGLAPTIKETAQMAAKEAKVVADKPAQSEGPSAAEKKILDAVADLAMHLDQAEVVAIATAVTPPTWQRINALLTALKEWHNDNDDDNDDESDESTS